MLKLLKIEPSARSIDFVANKKQFQLHSLLTEQRHPQTWNLSSTIRRDVVRGLEQIFSVDEDIVRKFSEMAQDTAVFDRAAEAVKRAIQKRKKIYIYGCGATGRLAKQLESAMWRPFWAKVKKSGLWKTLANHLPPVVEDRLIGEMTGGDRALISALEGLEDLELVGELQLRDRGIEYGDRVFCISEGGETSSVLGTAKAALQLSKRPGPKSIQEAEPPVFFLYNNPDALLRPLERSRSVIDNPAVCRINLTTGPQAIAGSTRMQAATSETFLMGVILEAAVHGLLQEFLTKNELSLLGFGPNFSIKNRLPDFKILHQIVTNSIGPLARLVQLESEAYGNGKRAVYFAGRALLPVFIDCAERSPTFHLDPLDTVLERGKKSWLQVWTGARTRESAWKFFLGRPFRGLDKNFYRPHFENKIKDAYLRSAALNSLEQAGDDQKNLFDFSFSARNIAARAPESGDIGILTCIDEEIGTLALRHSAAARFIRLIKKRGGRVAVITAGNLSRDEVVPLLDRFSLDRKNDAALHFCLTGIDDPLQLGRQILLKILFNGHSTGVMSRLGRVVGNTMTSVKPSNQKLIGRATALIFSHVNDTISQESWQASAGRTNPITYAQANAVLFEAMEFSSQKDASAGEVELSIIRILESLKRRSPISWREALGVLEKEGLENRLLNLNPALRS